MKKKVWLALSLILLSLAAGRTIWGAPFAYITNYSSNTVSVLNTTTNVVLGSIPVGLQPVGVAVDPAGKRIYITNQGSNTVSVIDRATLGVFGSPIPVGISPAGVAVNPAGTRVYVSNQGTSNVSVIDTATGAVIGPPIPVGLNPVGIAVNPSGKKVYVANQGTSNVSVIDAETATVISPPIPVGLRPSGVAVNPAGTRIYVTNQGSNNLSVIDTETETVMAIPYVGIRPAGVAVNPAGTRVYVANQGSSDLSILDAATNSLIGPPIPVGLNPIGVSVNPAGTRVYVANFNSNSVSVIDLATGSLINVATGGANPYGFGGFISPANTSLLGIYRKGEWYFDSDANGRWSGCGADGCFGPFGGIDGDLPVMGDFTGDGISKIGIYRQGIWYVDFNNNGTWDGCETDGCSGLFGGLPRDIPVVGDWTGDGRSKIGFYRQGKWHLDLNGNGLWDGCEVGEPDGCWGPFGGEEMDIPVAGDWTGDGLAKIGFYRQGIWYLDLNGNGLWDECPPDACLGPFGGYPQDIPVVGDWNREGISRVGIYRGGNWYLDMDGSGTWGGCAPGGPDACLGPFGGGPNDLPVIR